MICSDGLGKKRNQFFHLKQSIEKLLCALIKAYFKIPAYRKLLVYP